MRKLMVFLLLLCLALPAMAEENLWRYDENNWYLKLNGSLAGEVWVPGEVDGWAVNAIGSGCFQNQHGVTSLVLPQGVTALQGSAISWMDGLTEVTLPDGLRAIEMGNFSSCGALESVTVPASVRYVSGAFYWCESLREIRFEGVCPVFSELGWLFDGLPADCVIRVPDDQMQAYQEALADCAGAAGRLQPSGQPAVRDDAAAAESDFVFDAQTGTITGYTGSSAWLEIPATIGGVPVHAIGDQAFFGDCALYGVVIPEGVEQIGAAAFRQACNLAYIRFPDSLKVIADEAFLNATGKVIVWGGGLEEIGVRAFMYIRQSILCLPDTLRVIGDSAFEGAWSEELYLAGRVERIGARAFAGSALRYMAFDLHEPIDIAPDAFADTSVADLDLPWNISRETRDAYAAMLAEQCPGCTVWINNPVSGGVARLPENTLEVTTVTDGVWTAYHGEEPDLTIWTDYDGIAVTALGDGLFKGNQTIRSFYPHHCGWFTTIGTEAFADSSVEYVEMFDSITTLGDGAFRGCAHLTELTLPASLEQIGAGVLEGCTGLQRVTVLCDPSVLPQDMGEALARVETVLAAPDATDAQVAALSALVGRAWNDPVARVGEAPAKQLPMEQEPLPGEDFWYDEEYARLDTYQGYALNLVLPREIDGIQMTMLGGSMMGRACAQDGEDAELPVRSLVIPETITEIPLYALQNCTALETVICYAPLETVPEGLFAGCTSLREVVFVNGVRSLDRYVFDGCTSLQTVYLGRYVQEMSEYALLNSDQSEAFPLERCLTDPAQMPDVNALLAAVESEPLPTPAPTATPMPAMPVGEEGAAFFGAWTAQALDMGGELLPLADLGMEFAMVLHEDGTVSLTSDGESETVAWSVTDGAAVLPDAGMTLIPMPDGTLCMPAEGAQMIFVRADAPDGAGEQPAAQDGAAPADGQAAAGDIAASRLETRYVMTSADVAGVTLSAQMLGGLTYALTFHADGTAELVFAGQTLPLLPWSQQTVQTDAGPAPALVMDYFGSPLTAVVTQDGFDMNYFDSMLMHFEPEAQ
ncbi:MAG: leucine-rich repeat domain-containing protein [Candidatus Ventricola sp.]